MSIQSTVLLGSAVKDAEGFLQQGIELSVVGVAVVFVALIAIMIMLGALKNFPFRDDQEATKASPSKSSPPAQQVAAASPASAVPKPGSDVTDPELIAVITAAAIAAVGRPINVKRVRFVTQDSQTSWAETGRKEIHTSHRLRKNS